ncbi:MAG: sulfatase [Planctomycetota bacterium]
MRLPQVLCSIALIASCGGDAGGADADLPAVGRLQLQPLATEAPGSRLVHRFLPNVPSRPWLRKRGRQVPLVVTEGRAAAMVSYDVPISLFLDTDLETSEFDRVDVVARVPEGEEEILRVTLFQERTKVLVSEVVTLRGTGSFQRVRFPLAGIELHDLQLTKIAIQIGGTASMTEVAELDVIADRPASLLPRPGRPAALVEIRADARRGWGLDGTLGGRVETGALARSGGVLSFSYAVHPEAAGAALVVETGEGSVTRLPLQDLEPRWRTHRMPGVPKSVTFRVDDPVPTEALAWTAVAELHVERPRSGAPIALLITSDTHRGDHIGRGGTPGLVSTPNLDAFAARGVQFVDAFAPSNMTNPSHTALMTGLSPRDTRIVGNRAPLAEGAVTLAERFADAGWATAAAVSVLHIDHKHSGLGQGFDRFDGLEERSDYKNARRPGALTLEGALRWIDERDDVPLFLWLHVFDVHAPYEASAEYELRYLSESARPVAEHLDPVPRAPDLPAWIAEDERYRDDVTAAHARYRASVDQLDEVLVPLLDHPRVRAGVAALTADHGESFGRNRMWWTHHGLYRDQLHVPLSVVGPGAPPGAVVDAPVRMIDVGATLLRLSGLPYEDHPSPPLDLTGSEVPEPRFALGFGGLKATVAHEGWLLVMNLQDHEVFRVDRAFEKGVIELYRIETDPGCAEDLAAEEPERAARLRKALVRWLGDADPSGFATARNISDSAMRRLAELGYVGGTESTHVGAWWSEEEATTTGAEKVEPGGR